MRVEARALQHLIGHTFLFSQQAEEEVLRADVIVPQADRFSQAQLENLLCPRCERDVAGRVTGPPANDRFHLLSQVDKTCALGKQRLGADSFRFGQETKEEVLGPDPAVMETASFLLGEHHHPPSAVGEPFEHASTVTP